jgi:SsrA-binding protein
LIGRYRGAVAKPGDKTAISNRKARHDFEILETWECGIVLHGSEVKSLRDGRGNLADAFARIDNGEVWMTGMHISPYPFARDELDPVRRRKLLLHHDEIDDLTRQTAEKGLTLVPLSVYFKNGLAKVELALAKGRKRWDKRDALAAKDAQRDVDRVMKSRRQEAR